MSATFTRPPSAATRICGLYGVEHRWHDCSEPITIGYEKVKLRKVARGAFTERCPRCGQSLRLDTMLPYDPIEKECSDCGYLVPELLARSSYAEHGKTLCGECRSERTREKAAQTAPLHAVPEPAGPRLWEPGEWVAAVAPWFPETPEGAEALRQLARLARCRPSDLSWAAKMLLIERGEEVP